jgi:hypothetical protein
MVNKSDPLWKDALNRVTNIIEDIKPLNLLHQNIRGSKVIQKTNNQI